MQKPSIASRSTRNLQQASIMPGELSLPAVTTGPPSLPTVHGATPTLGDSPGPTVAAGMVSFDIPLALPAARESAPALT
ncbi:MAG: hypothetical protein ACN6N0_10175, partial [Microvirgula sp.]